MDLALKNKKWKEFFFTDIFEISSTSSGIDKNKLILKDGKIPYITRSEKNNGIDLFVVKQNEEYNSDNSNVITVGLDTQTVFYQSNIFYTGQNIQILKNNNLNKYVANFLIPLIKIQMEKFNWGGNGATLTRLKRSKLLLPVNSQEKPDYEFMEEYIRNKEKEKITAYKKYITSRIKELENNKSLIPLKDKKWKEFFINEIFVIKSGKRLTKKEMFKGDKPFIGSTDKNNGITAFVSNTNNSEDKNVLGVNYNGSVVENFYHPYKAIFSDDVKRLSFKEITGNRHQYLFAKTVILKQKIKYQYGYKFNAKRMSKQKIMLPVNKENKPDYEYMENYMKKLELERLKKYLKYKMDK